jgi:hypothetical protein
MLIPSQIFMTGNLKKKLAVASGDIKIHQLVQKLDLRFSQW